MSFDHSDQGVYAQVLLNLMLRSGVESAKELKAQPVLDQFSEGRLFGLYEMLSTGFELARAFEKTTDLQLIEKGFWDFDVDSLVTFPRPTFLDMNLPVEKAMEFQEKRQALIDGFKDAHLKLLIETMRLPKG